MSNTKVSQAKTWTRPELVRLGTINDVAGPGTTGTNSNGVGSKS